MALTLAQASTIVDVALKKGRDTNCAPLTVAVLDAGGHLVAFKREDRSGILRFDIAFGKAWGALGMGFGSRTLFERRSQHADVLHRACGGERRPLVPNPGGVLIKDAGGEIARRGRHIRRHVRQGRSLRDRRHRGGGTEGRSRRQQDLKGGVVAMKLYTFWRSIATFRVRMALNIKGVKPDVEYVDLLKGHQHGGDYSAVNPQKLIPALVLDEGGPPLFQSMAIMEYLEETHPQPPLLPKDARGRARVRGLSQIVVSDAHPLSVPRIRNYLTQTLKFSR